MCITPSDEALTYRPMTEPRAVAISNIWPRSLGYILRPSVDRARATEILSPVCTGAGAGAEAPDPGPDRSGMAPWAMRLPFAVAWRSNGSS